MTRKRDIRAMRREAQRHQYDALEAGPEEEGEHEGSEHDAHDGYQPVRERQQQKEESTQWLRTQV